MSEEDGKLDGGEHVRREGLRKKYRVNKLGERERDKGGGGREAHFP